VELGLSGSEEKSVVDSCEHSNGPSDSMKAEIS
jgi:hypothetical protein